MDQQPLPQDSFEQPEKRGMSGGAKIGIGCGVLAVIVIILICGGFILAGWWVARQAENYVRDLEQQNYTVVRDLEADRLHITETVTESTVFFTAQEVVIDADVHANVAIVAVRGEINGRVEGDVNFLGMELVIGPNSVITGDVHVDVGQAEVTVRGTVEGDVIGGRVR